MDFSALGRLLIVLGIVLVVVGLGIHFLPRIPWLGRLPGDILIKRDNFTFYFPITTGIVISILFSLILWLFRR